MEEKRGVVVISNIPHGFFEGQMERYFRQFGVLENLRLVRSKRVSCCVLLFCYDDFVYFCRVFFPLFYLIFVPGAFNSFFCVGLLLLL